MVGKEWIKKRLNMIDAIKKRLRWSYWCPSFLNTKFDLLHENELHDLTDLRHQYDYKWFADPFILDVTEKEIILLVEECDINYSRGRIAKLVLNKQTKELVSMKILLDLPTHLSFPAIYRADSNFYVYPENSAAGCLTMYLYDKNSETLQKHSVICDDPITDAIIKKIGEKFYMFGTVVPAENGNILSIYQSNTFDGHYSFLQHVSFNENIARGAGDIFEIDGICYRVSQICNNGYGQGLTIQKIIFKDGFFYIEEINRIPCPKNKIALHTYNEYNGVVVVDWRKEKHSMLRKIPGFFRGLLHNK